MDWFTWADVPLTEVRDRFGPVPRSPGAIEAGLVGPWEAGALSSFQVDTGRRLAELERRSYESYGATVAGP